MTQILQDSRQARIETSLGKNKLVLKSFSGTERLSSDFEYDAVVMSKDPSIDGNAIIGKPVTVTYESEDGRERHFNGFVSRFEYSQQIEKPVAATCYRLTVVPWLWFLKHNRDCQIFQNQKTPAIIEKIFRDLGFNDFQMNLSESYTEREYCVQYRETDFDFVSRLMEEEGIFYYFKHEKNKHVMVLCDSPTGYFDLNEPDVRYGQVGQGQFAQLTDWKHVYEFRPGKVSQKDFNFKKPSDGLQTEEQSQIQFAKSSQLELYEYPGRYDQGDPGSRLTKIRLQEQEAEHDHVLGSGSYLSFTPGGKFTVSEHSRASEEGKSFALIETFVELNSNVGFANQGGVDFKSVFRCIPAGTTFRPARRTPKPFVEGPQTAIVATDGQEIVVDEHARVKVQFHWDRYGKSDINSSCWIRVSQVHAGKGWGMMDIPRQNEEVIVSFLNGDPDRPIITGRVYNGDNPIPYGLKGAGDNTKNKTRRGNMTKSYGSDGYNEMTMDDTAGAEQIRINGQYDMNTNINNDETHTIGNNRTKDIGVDETMTVGNDQSLEVANNQSLDVGVDRTVKVGTNHKETIGSDQKIDVGSNQTISVGSMKTETVGMMSNEMVGVAKTTNVGVANSIIVGAAMNTAVGYISTEQVGMTKKTLVGSTYSVNVGSSMSIEAGDMIEIKCGASKLKLESGGKVTIEGTEFLFAASGCVKINGSIIDLN